MTLTLTPEIETTLAEQARREGTTPERVALDGLQNLFVTPKRTPEEVLRLSGTGLRRTVRAGNQGCGRDCA